MKTCNDDGVREYLKEKKTFKKNSERLKLSTRKGKSNDIINSKKNKCHDEVQWYKIGIHLKE